MKKYLIPIILFILIFAYLGYQEYRYKQSSYVKLDVIASTSDMKILADENKNIYVQTIKGLYPYFKDGKKVNLDDYKKEKKE